MTAHFAVVDTAPGWGVVAAALAAGAIFFAARWLTRLARESGEPLTHTINTVLDTPARDLCGVLTCNRAWTASVHGWRTCDECAGTYRKETTR